MNYDPTICAFDQVGNLKPGFRTNGIKRCFEALKFSDWRNANSRKEGNEEAKI